MKIVRPTAITTAMLTSSTVPETDYPAWSGATAYAVGNRCILASTHRIYECLVANTGLSPDVNLDGTAPKWLEVSATNRWKAFDTKVADQVSQAGSINYLLAPGMVDAIALLNMDATSVTLVMTDPTEGVVYNQTIDLTSTANVVDGYSYCFEPILRRTDLAVMNLPPYGSASLSITVTYAGGTAKCGEIVVGRQSTIGYTGLGVSISDIDYSRKDVDTFGNFIVVERNFSNKVSCTLSIDNAYVDEVKRLLSLYRATPLVWVAIDSLSLGLVYGYRKDFDVVIPYLNYSTCSLEIEGLT